MFSYLSLFLFLFGIVDGSLVDLAVERPGISVTVAECDGQRGAARVFGIVGDDVAGARRRGVERLGGESHFGAFPPPVPVGLWRRAVPVTVSRVPPLTNTGSSAGSLPGVKANSLPEAVVTVNLASWK